MADVGTLLMKVEADTKNFNKGIEKSKKAFKGFTKAVKVGAVSASAAIIGVGAKSIALAQDQERAEARLASIATTVTKATEGQIQSLKDLAEAQQEVSTFGDEVLIAGQSQLLSFGLQTDQVEQLTGSMADLLAANNGVNATQEDAIGAANLLGKAFSGQAGALSRVGILLDDAQAEILKTGTASEKTAALVDIMNSNYGGLAKTLSETTEGQMAQFKNSLGDVGEQIGFVLLPVLNKMIKGLKDSLPTIQRIGVKVFKSLVKAMENTSKFIKKNVIPIFEKIKDFWQRNKNTIIEAVQNVFNGIVSSAGIMWDFFNESILPIIKNVWEFIKENWPQIKSTAETVFNGVVTVLKSVWTVLEVTLLPILGELFKWFDENGPKIQETVETVFGAVETVFTSVNDYINDTLLPTYRDLFKTNEEGMPKMQTETESTMGGMMKVLVELNDFLTNILNVTLDALFTLIFDFSRSKLADNLFKVMREDAQFLLDIVNDLATALETVLRLANEAFAGGDKKGTSGSFLGSPAGGLREQFSPEQFGPTRDTPRDGGGIQININGPISSTRDADKTANRIVSKLKLAGVRT